MMLFLILLFVLGIILFFLGFEIEEEKNLSSYLTLLGFFISCVSALAIILIFLFCKEEIKTYIQEKSYSIPEKQLHSLIEPKVNDIALNCVKMLKRQGYEVRASYEEALDYCINNCALCREIYDKTLEEVENFVRRDCENTLKSGYQPGLACRLKGDNSFGKAVLDYCQQVGVYAREEFKEKIREEIIKRLQKLLAGYRSKDGKGNCGGKNSIPAFNER